MCRGVSHGGRRCPACEPDRRSSYRKARAAADKAIPLGSGGSVLEPTMGPSYSADLSAPATTGPVHKLSPQKSPKSRPGGKFRTVDTSRPLTEELNYARMLSVMGGIYHSTRILTPEEAEARAEDRAEELKAARAAMAAETGLDPEDSGLTLAAVTLIGSAVAFEAQRRAGVTPEDVATAMEVHRAQRDGELNTLATQIREHDAALAAYVNTKADEAGLSPSDPRAIKMLREEFTQHDQDYQALLADHDAAFQQWSQCKTNYAQPAEVTNQLAALAEAYREVLGELRPMGGVANFNAKTSKRAAMTLNAAMDYYPSDWIARHNETGQDLLARESTARASYNPWGKAVMVPDGMGYYARVVYDVPEDVSPFIKRVPNTPENAELYRLPHVPGTTIEVECETSDEEMTGASWEEFTSPTGVTMWRRPTTRKVSRKVTLKEILVEKPAKATGALGMRQEEMRHSAAIHEMAHRFEDVVPELSVMEERHLLQRTTLENGQRTPGVRLTGRETAFSGDFADAYMGKKPIKNFFEILSVAITALFGRETGGLVGGGNYQRDDKSRYFALGALASLGRTDMGEDYQEEVISG